MIATLPYKCYDFKVWQGDSWCPKLIYPSVSGVPVSFSGYTARMEIRTTLSGALIKTLITGSGITLPSTGGVSLYMLATETAAIVAGDYVYDLQLTSPAGIVKTYCRGLFTVTKDVTENT